jgi:hypothetical protein
MEPKKPLIRKAEWVVLLIAVLVIGYIVVDQGGCYTVKRAEQLEWVD